MNWNQYKGGTNTDRFEYIKCNFRNQIQALLIGRKNEEDFFNESIYLSDIYLYIIKHFIYSLSKKITIGAVHSKVVFY